MHRRTARHRDPRYRRADHRLHALSAIGCGWKHGAPTAPRCSARLINASSPAADRPGHDRHQAKERAWTVKRRRARGRTMHGTSPARPTRSTESPSAARSAASGWCSFAASTARQRRWRTSARIAARRFSLGFLRDEKLVCGLSRTRYGLRRSRGRHARPARQGFPARPDLSGHRTLRLCLGVAG